MKPQTKETAILMLVDSIEAASRTIDPPEREKFEEMIQRILFTKLRNGQLDESGLSVADLRTLVTRMSDTLVNMFHHRIRYPWQDQRRVTGPNALPSSPGIASISVRGTMSSSPPVVEGRSSPSIPTDVGSTPPSRDREPPPSIIVGPPLSLVPSPPSTPPSQETTSPATAPSFPQKKG